MIRKLLSIGILLGTFALSPLAALAQFTVTETTPTANAIDVTTSSHIIINFSATLDASTLTDANIQIRGEQTGQLVGTFSILGGTFSNPESIAMFDAANDFKYGERIQVTVTTGVKDEFGNSLANPHSFFFDTQTAPAPETPPVFSSSVITTMADGASDVYVADVDGDGNLDILSASQNDNTIAWYENDGTQSFNKQTVSTASTGTNRVYAADVDGDGDLDILSASAGNDTIAWWENDGAQNFTQNVVTSTADGANSVYAVDMEGDGDMDLLSTSIFDDTIAWYENDGSQVFTERVVTNTADGAYRVRVGDVDGDGDLDILSASFYDDTIAWWENDGAQSFTQQVVTSAADGAKDVYVADIDGDGDLDILSASQNDNTIAWYENNGFQSFTEQVVTTVADGAQSVHAVDVDGDGDMDLMSASFNDDTIIWYENDGAQVFTQRVVTNKADGAWKVHAADVDGDGDLDILSASLHDDTITWYENVDVPAFVSSTPSANANNIAVTSDITLTFDQNIDGTTATATNIVVRSEQEGTLAGSFSVTGQTVTFNPTTDFRNGDYITVTVTTGLANIDGVALGAPHTVEFSTQTAPAPETPPVFSASIITTTADGAQSVIAADLDGDGDLDLLSASSTDDTIAWYENDGVQGFTKRNITTSADGAQSVIAADLDGDGDLDIASASFNDDKIAWYENTGGGSFGTQQVVTTSADGAQSVVAADLDGDGDLDLASASANDFRIYWYENTGGGSFGSQQFISKVHTPRTVVAVDVDGDGDMDLASASSNDDKITWFENVGEGNFNWVTVTNSADGAWDVHAADLDADGDLDFLSASELDDTIAWYENDGSQSFTKQTVTTTADGARGVYSADLDGDGDLDILSASELDNTIAWYENDGSQNFTKRVMTSEAGGAWDVYAADVDGDGDLDILSASELDDTIAWYENVLATPPSLSNVSPAENSTAVSTDAVASITYDRAILVSDLSGISIEDAEGIAVTNVVATLSSDSTLSIAHDAFGEGTTYTATIPAGAVTNIDGIATTSDQAWSFTTILPDPALAASSPASGATGVALDVAVSITFDQSVTAGDLSAISIADESGTAVGNVAGTLTDSTVTIIHDNFVNDEPYTVTIPMGAVVNADGVVNEVIDWSFTTIVATPSAITLANPAAGATDISLQPSLEWASESVAEYYQIQLSVVSDFSSTIVDENNLTNSVYAITSYLEMSTSYYWRVRASNEGGTGEWSTTGNFTTIAEQTDAGPEDGGTDVALQPILTWADISWASGYEVQLSTVEDFSSTIINQNGLTESNFTVPSELSSSTTYYWRVRASNSEVTGEWSSAFSFTTVPLPPDAVTLVGPPDEATSISVTPDFSWNSTDGADNYTVELSTDNTFSNILLDSTVAGTGLTLTEPLQNETVYYWRVMATNSGGNSAWSTPGSFTTVVKVPVAVALLSPHDGSIGIQTIPTLIWAASAGADAYQVELSTGIDFSETIISETVIADTAFTPATALAHKTQHWWRVRGINEGGEGDWSEPGSFTTIAELVSAQAVWSFGEASGPQDYRLVALPGQVNESLQAVFAGKAGTDWQAFWDNGAEENYLVKYDGSETFDMAPGNGFWITGKESVEYRNQVPMVKLNSENEAVVRLHEGWNIISNPLDIDVLWSEIALANDISLQPIWSFNSSFSDLDNFPSAKSGEAFYFFNDQGLMELAIPYKEMAKKSKTDLDGKELQIITAVEGKVTSTSRLVFAESELKVNPDAVAPPGSFEGASLRFTAKQKRKKSKRSNIYARLHREYKNDGQSYSMVLSANPGENVEIRTEALNLDGTYGMALIDEETGRQYDLNSESDVIFIPEREKTNLILAIGNTDYLKQVLDKYLPKKFEVMPNYPNPFNPSTTLKFSLPQQGHVHLQVYDVLGRRVATLINGVRDAGVHTVRFDASRQASGLYFGVVEIGGQRFVQKMLLIK